MDEFFSHPSEHYFSLDNCSDPNIAPHFCLPDLKKILAAAPNPTTIPASECANLFLLTPGPTRPPTTITPTKITGSPTPQPTSSGKNYNLDSDAAGLVNQTDLNILLSYWNTAQSTADFNNDGKINEIDLNILLANWQDAQQATTCAALGGVCCTGDYGHCVVPRIIEPYDADGSVNTSGGCNPDRTYPGNWCCSGCLP